MQGVFVRGRPGGVINKLSRVINKLYRVINRLSREINEHSHAGYGPVDAGGTLAACERGWNDLKCLKDFYLNVETRIWP